MVTSLPGMDLDFGCKEEAKISMIPYVEEIMKDFLAATPAAEYLFQ